MKKISSLFFAFVSTLFLAVGATRASEKFDPTAQASVSATRADGPGMPCIIVDRAKL